MDIKSFDILQTIYEPNRCVICKTENDSKVGGGSVGRDKIWKIAEQRKDKVYHLLLGIEDKGKFLNWFIHIVGKSWSI